MNNVVTISLDIFIDEEKAVLIDSIISKFDKCGLDVSVQRVVEMAFEFGATFSTLTNVLKTMDKKLDRDLEKRCKNESNQSKKSAPNPSERVGI